jgi:CBS domain-containing protein
LVKQHAPITGEQIAEMLGLSRPTLRSDLALLVMLGLIDAKPKVGYFPGHQMAPEGFASRKLSGLKVKDVQAMPVIIRETTSVHDAVVTLFLEDVGGLIVANEEGSLTGVISRKDLLKFTLGNSAAGTMPVSLVMTRQPNIIYVSPEDSVLDAARKMILHQVDSVPVVTVLKDEAGQDKLEVVGRMTKTTMTKVLLELAVQSDI